MVNVELLTLGFYFIIIMPIPPCLRINKQACNIQWRQNFMLAFIDNKSSTNQLLCHSIKILISKQTVFPYLSCQSCMLHYSMPEHLPYSQDKHSLRKISIKIV
ncbi:hypothetical protein CISIN_1g034172mg [Citrus sinensis]|uniref:Uncharacterized protein n=1 Tax=Citrus sinensis TaxID=2711 RepID=A0A067E0J5_CITSI|nr:hypothetical protein CISIN_1g034172mg [Citrus sinensis]